MKRGRVLSIASCVLAMFGSACSHGGGSEPPPVTVYKNYAYIGSWQSAWIYPFSLDASTGSMTRVTHSEGGLAWGDANFAALHPAGKLLFVANRQAHRFHVFTINASTGALSEVDDSPFDIESSPRSFVIAPSGEIAYVADYRFPGIVAICTVNDVTGRVTESGVAAATVLSCFAVLHPSAELLFVVNKGVPSYPMSQSVSAFALTNAVDGSVKEVSGSPFITGGTEPTCIGLDPLGRFAYVTNRLSKSISAFTVDAATGALTAVAGSPFAALGDYPAFVAVDPSGKFAYVANQEAHNVAAYGIDQATGALVPLGAPGPTYSTGWSPVYIAFDPSGKFMYVANQGSSNISVFSMNPDTGTLIPVAGSPFSASMSPSFILTVRLSYQE